MKNSLFTFIALVGLVITLGGCSKDKKKNGFDYPIETLYGTWRVTHVEQKDGTMFDVTTPIAERYSNRHTLLLTPMAHTRDMELSGQARVRTRHKERLLLVMSKGKNF